MTRIHASSLAGALAVGAGVILMLGGILPLQTGCETQSAEDKSLRVEPHSIGLRINQSAEFTASGGFTYTWALSDPSLGVLTRSEGQSTTYISRFNPEPDSTVVLQRLTVTSVVGGSRETTQSTDGTTNNVTADTGFIDSAEALIEHLPTGDAPTSTTTPTTSTSTTTTILTALSISPSTVTLTSGQTRSFTATGQGPNYSWSLFDTSFGSLNTTVGPTVIYTANNSAIITPVDVVLEVMSNGQSDQAVITRLQ